MSIPKSGENEECWMSCYSKV